MGTTYPITFTTTRVTPSENLGGGALGVAAAKSLRAGRMVSALAAKLAADITANGATEATDRGRV